MKRTRDMTDREFKAALKRRGFEPRLILGGWVQHAEFPGTSFGLVYNNKPFKLARRASLAKLIRDVERHRAQLQQ